MRVFLILCLLPWIAKAETVRVPGPDGIVLNAELFLPRGAARGPAVVALHGCGGPWPTRDNDWGRRLAAAGHIVLMPDSFGSRGLGSQCANPVRSVTPGGKRREDALAALQYLARRPGTPPGGLVLMGWSNGGSTVLAAGRVADDLPTGLIRGLIAFYPGCRAAAGHAAWLPAAPLLILMGEADDWTPAAPCHALAERLPQRVTLVAYQGAYHDFDVPDRPVRVRDAASAAGGRAHTGSDPAGREDAIRQVPAFIAALP